MLNTKSYWMQLTVLILLAVGGMLVSSSLGVLIIMLIYGTPSMYAASDPATAIRISQTLVTLGTFLFPALIFSYMQERVWFNYNLANRRPHHSMVNIVLILSVTILPVVGLLSSFNYIIMPHDGQIAVWMQKMENAAGDILHILTAQRSSWALTANLLVLAVLAGVCEEFLFQGALQPLLTRQTGNAHIGILLTALIFSTIHFQFYGFIPRFILGIYLGYLLYWSKSLWLPILAHVLHNALSLLVDFTLQGRGIDTDTMQYTDVRGAIPLGLLCLLATAMGIVFLWRTHKELGIKS